MSGEQYSHYKGINVGSGPHYAQDWLNTDVCPTDSGTQPDLLADIFDYQNIFDKGSFKKAYVGHVLEHIDPERVVDAINKIAWTVEFGGQVMVVGPCIEKARATDQPQSLLDAIICNPETAHHPWAHSWTPTSKATLEFMQKSILENVRYVDISLVKRPEWPNPSRAAWQVAVVGNVS